MIATWSGKVLAEEHTLFEKRVGDVMADMVKAKYPKDTAKKVARLWRISLPSAVKVARGEGSGNMLSKGIAAEGWAFLEELGHRMTGLSYESWKEQTLNEIIKEAELARENISRLRARGESLAERATELEHLRAGPLPSPRRHARG